jgi:hypothetical protein
MSLVAFHRSFFSNLVWSALAGLIVTTGAAFLARFFYIGRLFLPFGDNGWGPLGDVIFNSCWVFVVLDIKTLWKSD